MKCANCNTLCADTAKFCMECGTPLLKNCASCNEPLPPTAKFCGECGTKVASQEAAVKVAEPAKAKPVDPEISSPLEPPKKEETVDHFGDAERRQLTVLFCDLVGSTELAVKLDPEDMRAILAAYRTVCGEAMMKYGSTIIQHSGDGAMIIFGYPTAHENATESAVLAAMDILAAFKDSTSPLAEFEAELNARIAINTGNVVVGRDGAEKAGEEISVIGDVPNLAARLQNLAEPGQIIVSPSTYRLTRNRFNYRDMGLQELKGFSDPVRCYCVESTALANATDAKRDGKRSTPLVGRNAELDLLLQRWEASRAGDGQVMLLSGEAGVGKSRILEAVNETVSSNDINTVRFFSSSFHTHSALNPILNELISRFGLDEETENSKKLEKLKEGLQPVHIQHLSILAKALNIISPDDDQLADATPEELKQKTFSAIVEIYSSLADEKPLLMEFEDIHWCDPTTLEVIDHFIGNIGSKHWYLVLAFRPDYKPPFRNLPYITSLTLNRFGKREITQLIDQIAHGKPLPVNISNQIVERADGIPLYAEEITRMVLESGWVTEVDGAYVTSGSYVELAIPDSLQGSLMARLDRFPSAKELAQIAATIGRRFSAEVLALVSGHQGTQLSSVLDQLLNAEIIYEHGIGTEKVYEFKHALVQDAAYQSLLKTARQKCHLRIAEVLESKYQDRRIDEPEVIARHFHFGGKFFKAYEYSLIAGKRALSNFASLEAITHLEHALEDLRSTPSSTERDKQEFEILVMLAVPQASALGYSHDDVSRTYERAMELVDTQENTSALLPVVYGLARYHMLGARFDEGSKYQEKLLELATKLGDEPMIIAGHRSSGATAFYLGHHKDSLAEMTKVIDAEISMEEREGVLKHDVVDLKVAAYSYASLSYWLIGEADTSRELIQNAILAAEETQHPFSIAFASCFGAWTYAFCGDYQECKKLAGIGFQISKKYSFQFWIGWAEVMEAWAIAKLTEDYASGIDQVTIGIQHWKETRSRVGLSYFLYLLAELNFCNGQYADSLKALNGADNFVKETGENFWTPEIINLRGQVVLADGSEEAPSKEITSSVEKLFEDAIASANESGSQALALRALTNLHILLSKNNSAGKTDVQLTELLGSLPQGSDTMDIEAAKSAISPSAKDAVTH